MNKILILSGLLLSVSACTATKSVSENSLTPKIGMPNPASKFCIDQGGRLDVRDEANGQVGYCTLKDGQVIEEWTFFRSSVKICQSEKAKSLIGRSQLSDAQISQERITVTIDPKTNIITQANCG